MNWKDKHGGHVECVDVAAHGKRRNENDVPTIKARVDGQGMTFYRTDNKDDPATMLVVDLIEDDEA